MTDIDDIDRRLLKALQADGRMTNQELARKIHLSPAACSERLKRLRERGVISSFTALLDPAEIGLPLLIFVEVSLDRTTAESTSRFAEAVQDVAAILECHMVAGGFDYLLKARVQDMAAYGRFLVETLTQLPGVRGVRTHAVVGEVKMTTELPL